MNSLLATLIDIVRFSAAMSVSQDTLKVARPRTILTDIFRDALSQAQIAQLADAITACADGSSDTLPILEAIESDLAGVELEDRLASASATLNELLVLQYVLRSGTDRPARLNIADARFFDYLEELQISSDIVLVGALQHAQGKLDVQLDANNRLLKRIAISYSADSSYPYLDLQLWSRSETTQAQSETMQAQAGRQCYQKDAAKHDLTIWSRDNKNRGMIRTRMAPLPYEIDGKHISMSLSALAGLKLLETKVLDDHGNTLVTCLRALQHVSHKITHA